MAWSTPLTAVSNAAFTAAQFNASVRDNLLETAVAKATTASSYFASTGTNSLAERTAASAFVSTSETSTSTSFTDLATAGPSVTVTSGPRILIIVSAAVSNSTVNQDSYIGYEVTGASTISPTGNNAVIHTSSTANARVHASLCLWQSVTAGSNTITAKYIVSGGTGTWSVRRVQALPF